MAKPDFTLLLPKRCEWCDSEYTPGSRNYKRARYCSKACNDAYRDNVLGGHTEECNYCGKAFVAQRTSPGHYCSNVCFGRAKTHEYISSNPSSPVEWRECHTCGAQLGPRPIKSWAGEFCTSCRDLLGSTVNTKPGEVEFLRERMNGRPCVVCGKTYIPFTQSKNTCSPECALNTEEAKGKRRIAKRAWKKTEAGKRHQRIHNRKRRAARYGNGPVDSIDPIGVFDRDKWRCYICGAYTPKGMRGSNDDRAPELDHVIPLAAGGTHTLDNVACSCRRCNGEKGATIYQTDLFMNQ